MKKTLEIIPLGGVGEFGMNSTILRFGGEMILIDAGMTFPSGVLGTDLGVDVIVPDISFLRQHQHQLRAIFLTHGHEDHAGAVSYVINEIPVPVYASSLTRGLISVRLRERKLYDSADLHLLQARQVVQVGPFRVEPLHVTHSFPDSFCFAITTPAGTIIWSGDFKFDQTPVDRKLSDVGRLSSYGEAGVLALFSDSTNSGRVGLAPSESSVREGLRKLFRGASRRIILSCFSSSIHRMQIVLDLAREFDRQVAALGRSMTNSIRVALELGYLEDPDERLIPIDRVRNLAPEKVVVLASGSQGEPMAALSRLAVNDSRHFKIEEGDIVILSARIIPGNEKLIASMVNHLFRRGAEVFDSQLPNVHASGHGYSEDLKLMLNLVKPRFFVPIHGEFQQLKLHARLALQQGLDPEQVHIIENGDVLCLDSGGASLCQKVPVGRRFIDDGILEEVHEVVLRDRRYLSEDGFVVVFLRLDRLSGNLIGEPELVSRGFVLMDESEELLDSTRREVLATMEETSLEEKQDEELLKEILRKRLKRFLRRQTGKRPMILPVTLEI